MDYRQQLTTGIPMLDRWPEDDTVVGVHLNGTVTFAKRGLVGFKAPQLSEWADLLRAQHQSPTP